MMQILIPTDFSENSRNAVLYALSFFKDQAVTFHLLHINTFNTDSMQYNAGISLPVASSGNIDEKFNHFLNNIKEQHINEAHQFISIYENSFFIEGIRKQIADNNIDLIVMGTKGASGLKKITVGSRTGEVITKVKCPILVIPEKARFKIPINIAFPTDFNNPYKNRILRCLLDIASVYNASVKVLRVAQSKQPLSNQQERNRDYIKAALTDISHSFHVVENPDLENALQSFITNMNIDMVAMAAKNLNFFQRILFKPKTAKISYYMEIPFLVLHE